MRQSELEFLHDAALLLMLGSGNDPAKVVSTYMGRFFIAVASLDVEFR